MTNYAFEEISVPRGSYVGWGNFPGQSVIGKVYDYSPTNGSDANGNPCPQIQLELLEEAKSFNKNNEMSTVAAGELVVLNAGQVSLKRALRAADPQPGDVVKITLANLVKVAKGTVKEYSLQIARGAAKDSMPAPAAAPAQEGNPFAAAGAAPAANPFA